jgi:hypothetical protein
MASDKKLLDLGEFASRKVVFHGSPTCFDEAKPSPTKRIKGGKVIYDATSLHATPEIYIALSYTAKRVSVEIEEKRFHLATGVSLYQLDKTISIIGVKDLDFSLSKLFGTGYLYVFDASDFHTTDGLGDLEVISTKPLKPLLRIEVKDPVALLKSMNIRLQFVDASTL